MLAVPCAGVLTAVSAIPTPVSAAKTSSTIVAPEATVAVAGRATGAGALATTLSVTVPCAVAPAAPVMV